MTILYRVFVTAFLDFATYKKFADSLAWETEVWIADMPDHMLLMSRAFRGITSS